MWSSLPRTVESSEPLLEDWYSGTSKELRASSSMDWDMSWSSSMPPMKSSSAHRGLPRTESSRGEGGWYWLSMSTIVVEEQATSTLTHRTGERGWGRVRRKEGRGRQDSFTRSPLSPHEPVILSLWVITKWWGYYSVAHSSAASFIVHDINTAWMVQVVMGNSWRCTIRCLTIMVKGSGFVNTWFLPSSLLVLTFSYIKLSIELTNNKFVLWNSPRISNWKSLFIHQSHINIYLPLFRLMQYFLFGKDRDYILQVIFA